MNEVVVRLAWVLGAVMVGIAAILIVRNQAGRHRPVRIHQAKLGAGVYLFTSATCADCEAARRELAGAMGSSGFVELSWESEAEVFRVVGVNAVPATLIVSEAEGSTLYPGRPDLALDALSP